MSGSRAHGMPLVGVGASAGGLEALTSFVAALPLDSGMAFFVVQHLDPALPSALVQLLSRAGPLRVALARDGATIEADVIHVAQPGSQLTIDGGVMRLQTNGKTFDRPIDAFLRSLARTAGQQSIGILLSGSGNDGCLGLTAVREAGGFTLVQDESAQFDGMPRAAIDAGVVDLVLSPPQIAAELAALVRHPYVRGETPSRGATGSDVEDGDAFTAILLALHVRRGVGFSRYKRPTLQRRILRRMVVRKVDSLEAYALLLAAEPSEIDALFEEVLINVTEFFRDAETFERLRVRLQQRLAEDRDPSQPLRIWVVGCSTGEEAYSLAMLAEESATAVGRDPTIRIFATDISEAALAVARAGIYPPEQCAGLGEARRERFFRPVGRDLQVLESLRERCVFARHDITHEPPFSRMDLVACRNLLIYFGSDLQQSIIPTLHYALRPGGLLLLGRAESVARNDDLFEPVDREHAIYVRRPNSRSRLPERPRAALGADRSATMPDPVPSPRRLESQADRILLARHAPPGVVVDAHGQVQQFRGNTTRFLQHGAGRATLDLLEMAHADLRRPLSESLTAARQLREEVVRQDIALRDDDAALTMTLRVIPLDADGATGHLVTFTTAGEPARNGLERVVRGYGRRLLQRLRAVPEAATPDTSRLVSTRAELGRLIEEHDARTNELSAANEQVLSSNEELQSTNEELQTAKEEVLAANEELTTVNEELEARNLMLSRANDDLANLLSSTNIPIVMVGQDRKIRWFTPSAGRVLNLIPGDIGRPIDHIKPALELPPLETLVDPVLADLRVREHVVPNADGHWFRVGVTPYRTAEDRIDGAVITIVDVDALKRAEAELLQQRTHAEWIVDTVREPLVIVDDALRIVSANPAYFRVFETTADAIRDRPLHEADERWNRDDLRAWLRASFPGGGQGAAETFELSTRGDDPRQLRLEARPILRRDDPALLLIAIQDVTELRERERLEAELVNGVLQAQAEERESLARELHDETGQALSALLVGLRALSEHIDDAAGRALVHELRERARELLDTVGRLARGLHPTTVEELGLVQAVRELAEGWSRVHAISLDLDAEADVALDALPPALQLAIYRVFQEGLTNVARHARAGEVTVVLRQEGTAVHVQVGDDGLGFDATADAPAGLGLRLMKRRVAQLGGRFSLETQRGSGTLLDVQVPLGASDG